MGVGVDLTDAGVRTSFVQSSAPTVDWSDVARVTINTLPDVALLKIFDLHLQDSFYPRAWHSLVHVCRNWRSIVFGSPRRLGLRLLCKASSQLKMLDVWPSLPIALSTLDYTKWGVDDIVAVLEHKDRISRLGLFDLPCSLMEAFLAAMHQPFPALTQLHLKFYEFNDHWHRTTGIDPASFLGGSAPHLQVLSLNCFPFPGVIPRLLLSTTHLVQLVLRYIPRSGYISPDEMVTCLSRLTRLKTVTISFQSSRLRDDRNKCPPPQTRTLLPVLTKLQFQGNSEYLECLVAQIDAPLLDRLEIFFLHYRPDNSKIPQFTEFIRRTPNVEAIVDSIHS